MAPEIIPLALPGVYEVVPGRRTDARGWFSETYSRRDLLAVSECVFVQDNEVFSASPGTLRGLHFQAGAAAQAKLVRVLSGRIFDVVLDLRREAGHFGRWLTTTLTAERGEQIFIPRGFAHGYCTLEPATRVAYKVDQSYAPAAERGVRWDDPALAIPWPALADAGTLSDKDRALPMLRDLAPQDCRW